MTGSEARAGGPSILRSIEELVRIERDAPWDRPRIEAMPPYRDDRYYWPGRYIRRRLEAGDPEYIGALIAGIAEDTTWSQSGTWLHDALATRRGLEVVVALARLPPTEARASTLVVACMQLLAWSPTAEEAAHVIEAMHPDYERHFVHTLIDCTVTLAGERPLGDRVRLRLATWIERGLASEHLVPEHRLDRARSILAEAHWQVHGIAAAEAYVASLGDAYGHLLDWLRREGPSEDEPRDGHTSDEARLVEAAHLDALKRVLAWSNEDPLACLELYDAWPDATPAKLVSAYVALLAGLDGSADDPFPSASSTVLHHLHRADEAQAWAMTHCILNTPDHPLCVEAQCHLRYPNSDRILDALRAAGLEVRALPAELERGSGWAHLTEILVHCGIACPLMDMHKSEFGDERPKHPVLLNRLGRIAPPLVGFEFDELPAGEHPEARFPEGPSDAREDDDEDEMDGPVCLLANDFERGYRSWPLVNEGPTPALVFINALLAELGAPQRIFTSFSRSGPPAGIAVCLTPAQRDALVDADLFR